MNGSQQQSTQGSKNVFESLGMSSVGYLPDTYKVDLDQDDDTPDVVGLMPHVDAMAMAAESSPVPMSKQPGALCIQPATTYGVNSYNVCGGQQPEVAMSATANVYPNMVTLVGVPSNLTPISVTNVPPMESVTPSDPSSDLVATPVHQNVAHNEHTIVDDNMMASETTHQSVTCSVNEFLKTGRRKGTVEIKEEKVVDDNSEVAGKLKRLEVRTLFVDFDKRREDLKDLQHQFPSMNTRQLDSLYMKVGCDKERAIEALAVKMEEEEAKRLKALEDWKKNYDSKKIIKRIGGKNVVSPVIKRAKFDDSGDGSSAEDTNSDTSKTNTPFIQEKIMFPNQRIPPDVRVYKKFFRRVEPSDAGSRINAFMERNVVEYAAADSEEKARPVRIRNHVRHDDSPCVGRSSIQDANLDAVTRLSQEAVIMKKEDRESASLPANVSIPVPDHPDTVKSDVIPEVASSSDEKNIEESKTVNLLGLDDDDDVADNNVDDEVDEDRLSTTSSNTRASNSSGGGASGANKFFRNKVSTAAALHKRAYVSRELNQAWSTGNKRQLPHPVLDMAVSPAVIGNTPPLQRGSRPRARVWTATSDATPVIPGKTRGSFGSSFTPPSHLKIPTDSNESSPTPHSFSSSPLGRQQTTGLDQGSERQTVLDFFNSAEMDDLAGIPGCSRKKSILIISMRPFLSMKDLTTRLDRERSLSGTLIGGCKELLQMRANVNRLLTKCQKISSTVMPRVSSLMSQVQPESSDQANSQTLETPSYLNKEMSLKPYQVVGVKWLKMLHSLNLNGILADEMGLGKTVQTIAFLASLMESGDKGPHLVIVPSTALENWCREFDIWCPSLRVLLYYGSFEERKAMRKEVYESGKNDFNIILTTYSIATNSIEDRTMMKRLDLHYGVFDEAHMLKNMTSQRYRYLMTFKIQRRLLLTGTPLQNNLLELMSLLSFVMPNLFGQRETSEVLKRLFQTCSRMRDDVSKSESNNGAHVQTLSYEKQRILQAKSLLRPFILRRLKSHVLSQLPPKLDVVERVALPPVQRLHYVDMITEMRDQLRRIVPGVDSVSVGMLLQLRKAANHTLLHRRHFTNEILRDMARTLKKKEPSHKKAKEQLIYEDLCALNDFEIHKICELYKDYIGTFALPKEDIVSSSGKLMYLDAALPSMLAAGDRVLLFSQFVLVLDVIEEFLRLRGYRFVRMDGTTRVMDRQELIDKFQTDPDVFIFLLSTRCGGLGINLTAANVVILHDIDYNPYNDRQAEDRCHRVGQARNVRVIRLLAANTVEEGMYHLACDKLRLEEDITGDFNSHSVAVKQEPEEEDEEEDDNDDQAGGPSQKRSLASLSKAVEARQDKGVELSGPELKEVQELLREALYPSNEKEKDGALPEKSLTTETINSSSSCPMEVDVKRDSQCDNKECSSLESQAVTEVIMTEREENTIVPDKQLPQSSSDETIPPETSAVVSSSEVKNDQCDTEVSKSDEVPAQKQVLPADSSECDKGEEIDQSLDDVKCDIEDNSCGLNNLQEIEVVEEIDHQITENQHSTKENTVVDLDSSSPEANMCDTQTAGKSTEVTESSVVEVSNISVPRSSDDGPGVVEATHSVSTVLDVDTTDGDVKSNIPDESSDCMPSTEKTAAIQEHVQETVIDEVCSIHSNNEKSSNPSEISEDSRPLIISEQRSSTDSEEIDVVGET